MADPNQSIPAMRPRRRLPWILLILVALIAVGSVSYRAWKKRHFPYGESHSCSKGLGLSLLSYAKDTSGWFPFGMNTPEASLSLICTNDASAATWFMRGKHLHQSAVDQALARNGVLDPESCGWHYVEGLRDDDDPQLAIAWDKTVGLGHNGNLQPDYEHEVVMRTGMTQFIRRVDWSKFVEEQKQLLATTAAKRPPNSPPIRWSDDKALGTSTTKPGTLKH